MWIWVLYFEQELDSDSSFMFCAGIGVTILTINHVNASFIYFARIGLKLPTLQRLLAFTGLIPIELCHSTNYDLLLHSHTRIFKLNLKNSIRLLLKPMPVKSEKNYADFSVYKHSPNISIILVRDIFVHFLVTDNHFPPLDPVLT